MADLQFDARLYHSLDDCKTGYFAGIKGTTKYKAKDFQERKTQDFYTEIHNNFTSRLEKTLPNFTELKSSLEIRMNCILDTSNNTLFIYVWYGVSLPKAKIVRLTVSPAETIAITPIITGLTTRKFHFRLNLDCVMEIGDKRILTVLYNGILPSLTEEELNLVDNKNIGLGFYLLPRQHRDLLQYDVYLHCLQPEEITTYPCSEDSFLGIVCDTGIKKYFYLKCSIWKRKELIGEADINCLNKQVID